MLLAPRELSKHFSGGVRKSGSPVRSYACRTKRPENFSRLKEKVLDNTKYLPYTYGTPPCEARVVGEGLTHSMLTHTKQTRGMGARRTAVAAIGAAGRSESARYWQAAQSACLISEGFCPVVGRTDSRPASVLAGLRQQQPNSGRNQT